MSTPNDGGQAFPHGDPTNGGDVGMSLRDWFAGKALAGVIAAPDSDREDLPFEEFAQLAAAGAYIYADAMLAERAKNKGTTP